MGDGRQGYQACLSVYSFVGLTLIPAFLLFISPDASALMDIREENIARSANVQSTAWQQVQPTQRASPKEIRPTCSQQLGGLKRDSFSGSCIGHVRGLATQPNHNSAFKQSSGSTHFVADRIIRPFSFRAKRAKRAGRAEKLRRAKGDSVTLDWAEALIR